MDAQIDLSLVVPALDQARCLASRTTADPPARSADR
jgi:hypothetical protein